MITVVILGAGNVAIQLHNAFSESDCIQVIQGYNRSYSNKLQELKIKQTQHIHELKVADVYIVAVSDDAIEEVTNTLPFDNRLVVHTSGSTPMLQIAKNQRQGVFYPIQTFNSNILANFVTIPICIEVADQNDLKTLEALATAIKSNTYKISSTQRNILHVAAVFANNFSNLMYIEAKELCDSNQIPFEIIHPLIQQTATKIQAMDPKDAQTGPARRNDHKTLTRHLETLETRKQKELYQLLTNTIQQHYGKEL